ncbi:hypothetical protein ACWGLC_15995 [Dietzia sp. NPDC055877]
MRLHASAGWRNRRWLHRQHHPGNRALAFEHFLDGIGHSGFNRLIGRSGKPTTKGVHKAGPLPLLVRPNCCFTESCEQSIDCSSDSNVADSFVPSNAVSSVKEHIFDVPSQSLWDGGISVQQLGCVDDHLASLTEPFLIKWLNDKGETLGEGAQVRKCDRVDIGGVPPTAVVCENDLGPVVHGVEVDGDIRSTLAHRHEEKLDLVDQLDEMPHPLPAAAVLTYFPDARSAISFGSGFPILEFCEQQLRRVRHLVSALNEVPASAIAAPGGRDTNS